MTDRTRQIIIMFSFIALGIVGCNVIQQTW
jgi:hypothetical protein